jgi:dipeptide/tripeptide permease
MDTMQDVLTKLKAKQWLYIQLAFGLIFLGLVGLYTFSYNAYFNAPGHTHSRFHIIGIVAAAVGELFSHILGSQFVSITRAPLSRLGCSAQCSEGQAHGYASA